MKRILTLWLMLLLLVPVAARAGAVKLAYDLKPGQTWRCSMMNRMEFTVMGNKQVNRNKDTLEYKVSKGPKKGWVHLTVRYVNPPVRTEENRFGLQKYDMVFEADMHRSGQVRHITYKGHDTPAPDPAMTPAEQQAYIQGKKTMAPMFAPAVFWFPELPEDALAPGDEFEARRKDRQKQTMMNYASDYRQIFTLDEVSQKLAYFEVRVRLAAKTQAMGQKMTTKGGGKGEAVFDLKTGMWTEMVTKQKISSSGGAMMGGSGQPMLMINKTTMQRQ